MVIEAKCSCGKRVLVNEEVAGEIVRCIRCGRKVEIPIWSPEPTQLPEEEFRPTLHGSDDGLSDAAPDPAAISTVPVTALDTFRESLYWVIALAFLPLAVLLGRPDPPTLYERIERTILEMPEETQAKITQLKYSRHATIDMLFNLLPDNRIRGALLRRDTTLHWPLAVIAAATFWLLAMVMFVPGATKARHLLYVGMFTGTIGIGILLTAFHIEPIRAFLDFCHDAGQDRKSSFFLVFCGFTFGVGLIEETVKALPLLWYVRRHNYRISWRKACLWGLASGIGFGVAEGVHYSTEFYNGIETASTYMVRFASCVALHAIWTASLGITLSRSRELFTEVRRDSAVVSKLRDSPNMEQQWERAGVHNVIYGFALIRVVAIVMFLHGLYDAALTRGLNGLALLTAVASFGWLAWQIETCRREEFVPESAEEADRASGAPA